MMNRMLILICLLPLLACAPQTKSNDQAKPPDEFLNGPDRTEHVLTDEGLKRVGCQRNLVSQAMASSFIISCSGIVSAEEAYDQASASLAYRIRVERFSESVQTANAQTILALLEKGKKTDASGVVESRLQLIAFYKALSPLVKDFYLYMLDKSAKRNWIVLIDRENTVAYVEAAGNDAFKTADKEIKTWVKERLGKPELAELDRKFLQLLWDSRRTAL